MKPIAILHEGNNDPSHDNKLLKQLLTHLKLDVDLVDFYGMSKKINFFNPDFVAYRTLKQRVEDGQVKKILFIADSDYIENDHEHNGFENTHTQLEIIIKKLEIEDISSIYVMCDPDTKTGYLESFLLSTIPEDKRHCIKCFLECSGFKAKDGDKSVYKRIYQSVAHPFSPYQFEHPHFDELKQKLRNLF